MITGQMFSDPEDEFQKYVDSKCWSCFEGCCCGRKRGHRGKHKCAAKDCDSEKWTTNQEKDWMDKMKKGIK